MRFLKIRIIIRLFLVAVFILLTVSYSFAGPITVKGHYIITTVPELVLLIISGILVGILGTLIGAGGGFLLVPTLIIFFGFSPQHAIGTSLGIVFLNALSGTFSYIAQKRIDYELGVKFAVVAVPGVILGAVMTQTFSLNVFSIIFGLLLILMAYLLLFTKEFYIVCRNAIEAPKTRVLCDAIGQVHTYTPDLSIGFAGSFFVGVISGLFGIGGGIIHVPLMNFIRIPIHIATATSHFIIVITSLFGAIIFMGLKEIDYDYSLFIGIGTIFGAYWGAKIAIITGSEVIKKIIGFVLLLLALKLIFNVI